MKEQETKKSAMKTVLSILPLLIFFLVYKFSPYPKDLDRFLVATAVFIAFSIVAMALSWLQFREIEVMSWVSLILILAFGGLTLYFQDESFLKIKPTILNGLFSVLLLGAWILKYPLFERIFSGSLPKIHPDGWLVLTRNWGLFFLFVALLNEFVWRNFSTDNWVTFKVWILLPLNFLFAMSQVKTIMHYNLEEYNGHDRDSGDD